MSKSAAVPRRSGRPLLDFEGAAEYLGLSERYMRRLVAEKRIPHIKMSASKTGRIRFDPDRLDEWIASRAVPVDA
jgi:excisionase family DNA binding protein